jgi:hypothetical protein
MIYSKAGDKGDSALVNAYKIEKYLLTEQLSEYFALSPFTAEA